MELVHRSNCVEPHRRILVQRCRASLCLHRVVFGITAKESRPASIELMSRTGRVGGQPSWLSSDQKKQQEYSRYWWTSARDRLRRKGLHQMSKFAMIFAFVILASMNIGAARAAQTKSFSGKQLFDLCTSDQRSSPEFAGCVLYIKGFMADLDLADDKHTSHTEN